MKIIYYSYPFFADCDFSLIKALQDRGVDIHYYMPLHRNFQKSSILDFGKPLRKLQFVKASKIEDMQIYKDCIDLNRLYFIKGYRGNKFWIPTWCLYIYTLYHMKRQKADVIHIDWQFGTVFEKFLFSFTLGKRIITVHDPIMHSGQPNAVIEEKHRVYTFRWAEHYILLNKLQTEQFRRIYRVKDADISFSHLPSYDSISKIQLKSHIVKEDYILFFGQIKAYKGLEYLLDAMIQVHNHFPKLKLVIAGDGCLYFDKSKYEGLDYIYWIHRYVGISELAGLLKDAKFVVCPYKDATQSGVIQTTFAMEIPVIASNVGALTVDVMQNENGLLVPPCDVNALSNAIIKLYGDKHLLMQMRNNLSSQKLNDKRNFQVADEYMRIYQKVCIQN